MINNKKQTQKNNKKCKCGLHKIPPHVNGVQWYWGYHAQDKCTVEFPNERCWCGRLRTEHQNKEGHDPNVIAQDRAIRLDKLLLDEIAQLDDPEFVATGEEYTKLLWELRSLFGSRDKGENLNNVMNEENLSKNLLEGARAEIVKLQIQLDNIKALLERDPATLVPMPMGWHRENGGVRCDMAIGPCACGSTHDGSDLIEAERQYIKDK